MPSHRDADLCPNFGQVMWLSLLYLTVTTILISFLNLLLPLISSSFCFTIIILLLFYSQALQCNWHQVNNYRVLCAWLHTPNAGGLPLVDLGSASARDASLNPYLTMTNVSPLKDFDSDWTDTLYTYLSIPVLFFCLSIICLTVLNKAFKDFNFYNTLRFLTSYSSSIFYIFLSPLLIFFSIHASINPFFWFLL